MTISNLAPERGALETIEPRLTREGYKVVRDPGPSDLPEFLRGARPDAIAIGGPPNLLIEVLDRSGYPAAPGVQRLEDLRSSLIGHLDWRLEVVYLRNTAATPELAKSSQIRKRIEEVRKAVNEEPSGALLLGWSLLEASVRALEPLRAAKALSSSAMIELAVSLGHLDQADGESLHAIGRLRNSIAHGDLSARTPTAEELSNVLRLTGELADKLAEREGRVA